MALPAHPARDRVMPSRSGRPFVMILPPFIALPPIVDGSDHFELVERAGVLVRGGRDDAPMDEIAHHPVFDRPLGVADGGWMRAETAGVAESISAVRAAAHGWLPHLSVDRLVMPLRCGGMVVSCPEHGRKPPL